MASFDEMESLTLEELSGQPVNATESQARFEGTPWDDESIDQAKVDEESLPDHLKVMRGLASPRILKEPIRPEGEELPVELPGGEGQEPTPATQVGEERATAEEEKPGFGEAVLTSVVGAVSGQKPEDVSVEGTIEGIKHRVKLANETVPMTIAELGDFFTMAPKYLQHWMGLGPDPSAPITINGVEIPELNESNADLVKNALTSAYSAVGMEPSLEEARDIADIGIKLSMGNAAPGGVVLAGSRATSKVLGAADEMAEGTLKFLREELKYGTIGAATGTTAASLMEGSIEEKESVADLYNLFGAVGVSVFEASTLGSGIKTMFSLKKKMSQTQDLFEDEKARGLAQSVVESHLRQFIPEEVVPEVMRKIQLVEKIQRSYPGFQPTNGNIIGTEETRMIQRITDSKNFDLANKRYQQTKLAVEDMVKDLAKEPDPARKVQVAAALRMLAKQTEEHAELLKIKIKEQEDVLRSLSEGDTSAVQAGKDIRDNLNALKEQYSTTVDDLYKAVDPDDTIRFDATKLINKVHEHTLDVSPSKVLFDEDVGAKFIKQTLPAYIKAIGKRHIPQEFVDLPANVRVKEVKTNPQVTFMELHDLRSDLLSRASDQNNAPNVRRVMTDIANSIEETMDSLVGGKGEGVLQRYNKAKSFTREQAYPRYREGAGAELIRKKTKTGGFIVKDDEIGPTFWQAGRKGSNLEEFNKIFSAEHKLLREAIPDQASRAEIAEEASAAAKETLKRYAVSTLQDALDKAPTKDPLAVMESWKTQYKQALKDFPEVAEEIAKKEDEFRALRTETIAQTSKINELNRSIVKKYSGVEPSTVIPKMLQESTEEVERQVNHILRGVMVEKISADPAIKSARIKELETIYPEGIPVDLTDPDVIAVRRALEESVSAHMVNQAYDPEIGFTSGKKLDGLIHRNREKLEKIFGGEEGLQGLVDLKDTLILMGKENVPMSKKELNNFRLALSKIGTTPASISSRMYAAALDKVGPVYIGADIATRLFSKITDVHFDAVYREVMYDTDALIRIMQNSNADKAARELQNSVAEIKKIGIDGLKKMPKKKLGQLLNQHLLLAFGRNGEDLFSDDVEEENQGAPGSIMQFNIEMNDNLTGQESRVSPPMFKRNLENSDISKFERGEILQDEEVEEAMTDVELETAQAVGETPTDDKTFTANIVKNQFESAGLDPETGLIFAQIESSMRSSARPPVNKKTGKRASSAAGLFQFIDSTWDQMVDRHGEKYGITEENADKLNPEHNAAMGAEFLKENADSLQRSGIEPTPENLYAAHFLGAGGAKRLLRALNKNPSAPASAGATEDQIEANPSIFKDAKGNLRTLKEVFKVFEDKVDKARNQVQSFLTTEEGQTAEA